MTKYKFVIGIIMTVVTLSCIIASSFAWFSASKETVDGTGASMTAKDPSILTISDDIVTIQDMGNYKGQTSFAFYRYIEDENNPAFEGKYILDKNGNKITKNFPAYDYSAELREEKEFTWDGRTLENVGIYSLSVVTSTVSGVLPMDNFLLKATNSFDYETAEDCYLTKDFGNTLVITDIYGTQLYDDNFQTINISDSKETVTVYVGVSMIILKVNTIFNDYTTYFNTDNTTTVYDRLVSPSESKRYSVKAIDGYVSYDSNNEGTEITFDKDSGITNVTKLVRTDEGTCKKVYEDSDGNFTMEDKTFRIVKYVTEMNTAYYKIFDKSLRPTCIYDGETSGVTISVSEKEITTYAVDDGTGMEDSAYNVAIQFEMLLKTTGTTEYFLRFTPNTLGIVPVRDAAKEKLLEIEGTTTGDVYYTYVDSDKIVFGLDVTEKYIDSITKTTTVNNYEGDCKTETDTRMYLLSNNSEYGKIRYETTRGYAVYYSEDGGNTFQYLTNDVNSDSVALYVDIRGEKIAYDQTKHGDLVFALKTTMGYEIYVRDEVEYSTIFDQKGNLISAQYNDSNIFVYVDGETKCAVYTEITDKNRERVADGLENNTLYTARKTSVVYDSKGETLYSSENGNIIATTKRTMYFLPLESFYKNYTMEIEIIDHTYYNDVQWDNLTAEEKNNLLKTYKIDSDGKIVDEDGNVVYFSTAYSTTMLIYCVARVYYSDPYTFENMHSDVELKYNYDYNLAVPMYTVESSGSLKQFAYSDYAFMGSHFLIRLNVESGEKGASD